LNELVGRGKVLEKVVVFDIVYFDNMMLKALEKSFFQGQTKYGKNGCDTSFLQRGSPSNREYSGEQ